MTKLIKNRRASLFLMFSLRDDLDDLDEIDANIRSGVEIFGTNLWVLIFAILIASVGLNMNSTPVIIGAMLISPLMGPIIGMGYGLAINDMAFVRKALSSFAIFTAISLITSIVYFYISPLKEPGSELLARTSPTLWDVLIAFFGGAAGIIAITRRGISNVVPGMAIATALMPPLCTAGYSIARGKWEWMGGAIYLYMLNTVFIAYATLLFIKLMRLNVSRLKQSANKSTTGWITALTLVAMIAPSIYLGWRVVQTQRYTTAMQNIVETQAQKNKLIVIRKDIDPETYRVHLTIAGEASSELLLAQITSQIQQQGLPKTHLSINSISNKPIDIDNIRRELQEGVIKASDQQRDELRSELAKLQVKSKSQEMLSESLTKMQAEIKAQYPSLKSVTVGLALKAETQTEATSETKTDTTTQAQANTPLPATSQATPSAPPAETVLVQLTETEPLPAKEKERLENWLAVRLAPNAVLIAYTYSPPGNLPRAVR